MSYLLPITIFLFVLSPVIIPAIITAVHALLRWTGTHEPSRTMAYHRAIGRLPAAEAA